MFQTAVFYLADFLGCRQPTSENVNIKSLKNPQNSSAITSDGWSNHEHNWSDFEQNYEYQMMKIMGAKISDYVDNIVFCGGERRHAFYDIKSEKQKRHQQNDTLSYDSDSSETHCISCYYSDIYDKVS